MPTTMKRKPAQKTGKKPNKQAAARAANKAFRALPPAKQRVEIAKDLIAHIKAGRVLPTEGSWLATHDGDEVFVAGDSQQMDKVIRAAGPCDCCQVGGLMYAAVCRANAVQVKDVLPTANEWWEDQATYGLDLDNFSGYLEQYFAADELKLMEFAFEGGVGRTSLEHDELPFDLTTVEGLRLAAACLKLHDDHHEPEDRMVAICRNLIQNSGEFRP